MEFEELEFIDISRPEERNRPTQGRRTGTAARSGYVQKPKDHQRSRVRDNQRPGDNQRLREIDRQRQIMMKKKRRRQKRRIIKGVIILCELGFIIILCFLIYHLIRSFSGEKEVADVFNSQRREVIKANETEKPDIIEDFLTINDYSRPGEELKSVNNIFVHYTANPGTSAAQNRSYFENLGVTGETSASAHFVIGYDGEIIQCIPLDEIAYAVMQRNYDSVSIECCYLDADGKFTDATYQSLIQLSAWLLKEYKLTPQDMRRHYDEGGKKCPLYYVEHEEAWEQFLKDLENYIMEEQV